MPCDLGVRAIGIHVMTSDFGNLEIYDDNSN